MSLLIILKYPEIVCIKGRGQRGNNRQLTPHLTHLQQDPAALCYVILRPLLLVLIRK